MNKKSIQIQQLNSKLSSFALAHKVAMPPTGWIKAIRTALGMTMQQLANKLSVTKQSVMDIEKREQEGAITLKALREVARVLDMELVYGFIPKDGTLDALIDRKARELAKEIVMRASHSMKLEDQENSAKRLEQAIAERAEFIKIETPKMLWN